MPTRPVKSLVILTLILCGSGVFAQSPRGTQFKIAGTHSFEVKKARSWTVDREEINDENGEKTVIRNVASEKGEKLELFLRKSPGRVTTYNILAKGDSFLRSFRITVFDADRVSSFYHQGWGNPDVRTYIMVPGSLNKESRVLLVMHGLGRNADDYIASWADWGAKNDYIIVCPEFDNKDWPSARSYNLGNIFTGNSGAGEVNDRSAWSFQIVEEIFKMVRSASGLERDEFDIFGHSAGAQFVHRFAVFNPDSKFRIAISANAGWYTLPDLELKFPYGLKHAKVTLRHSDLVNWSKRRVLVMRGTADTERTANLRQSPEADLQGRNRYERAGFMFEQIRSLYPATNWKLVDVPGVGHDQRKMAVAAQKELENLNSN